MCNTGGFGSPCIYQRGFNGDRCVKPKWMMCPDDVEDEEDEEVEDDEVAQRKNSSGRLPDEIESDKEERDE